MKSRSVLLGIDGGGTHTRVLCTDLEGNTLAAAQGAGTNPDYNSGAHERFQDLCRQALVEADRRPENIAALAAGLAGLDNASDLEWSLAMTSLPGMPCAPLFFNDSVVAQAGAFSLEPGILAILSTGAITVGLTEQGEIINNYDFNHYARASARFISHAAVYRLLTDEIDPDDRPFLDSVLQYWQVDSLDGLRQIAKRYLKNDREANIHAYGSMAPLLTEAALHGSPLARRVCDEAANGTVVGIQLVAGCFEKSQVAIALHGGVALSP